MAFFAEAIGVAIDVKDGGTVKEAVESGAGHDGVIGEDVPPVSESLVAGEDDGSAVFVTIRDDLEEEAGLNWFEAEIADFIEDKELWPGEIVHLAGEAVFGESLGELARDLEGVGEVDAMSEFRAANAQGGSEVTACRDSDYPEAGSEAAHCGACRWQAILPTPGGPRRTILRPSVR